MSGKRGLVFTVEVPRWHHGGKASDSLKKKHVQSDCAAFYISSIKREAAVSLPGPLPALGININKTTALGPTIFQLLEYRDPLHNRSRARPLYFTFLSGETETDPVR